MRVAVTSYLVIHAIGVGGLQALEGDSGGEELVLGGRFFGIEDKDIHILGGAFKRGDHTLGRGGTWTSYAGPDRDSEVTVDRSCP